MLRFYREFVIKAMLVILWAKARARLGDCYQYVRDNRSIFTGTMPSSTLADFMDTIPFNGDQIEGSLDEMATEMAQQLCQLRVDGDLIDTMVHVLGLPHAASVLSGRTLEALRKAILLPDEIAGLRTRLAEQELHCSNCARPFVSNEMLCIVRNTTGTSPAIYCAACRTPTVRACTNCNSTNKVALSTTTIKGITRACTCDTCKLVNNDPSRPVDTGTTYRSARIPIPAAPSLARGNRRSPLESAGARWASGLSPMSPDAPLQGVTVTSIQTDELSPFDYNEVAGILHPDDPRSGG